jgi:Uma2 family endonuclease
MAWINTLPLVKIYTLDEFWQLPEPPDRSKLELIAGVLYMMPLPESAHDRIVARLNRLLALHLEATRGPGAISMSRAPRSG